MTDVVINKKYGGFSLSPKAMIRYYEIKGQPLWVEKDVKFDTFEIHHYWLVPEEERIADRSDEWSTMTLEERREHNKKCSEQCVSERDFSRNDPILVQVVKELGKEANGKYAELAIVEVPDDVEWQIEEYDGNEWVAEKHRIWS